MIEDVSEHTPGSAAYWDRFYESSNARGSADRDPQTSERFEWFMPFEVYWRSIEPWIMKACEEAGSLIRVLHPGCGLSTFSEDLRPFVAKETELIVVNYDICATMVEALQHRFPHRIFCVGDACDLSGDDTLMQDWWSVFPRSSGVLQGRPGLSVQSGSVDLIFDKGTLDALLSSFAGLKGDASNPNGLSYCKEALRVLRRPDCRKCGGFLVGLSINSRAVLEPYFFGVEIPDEENPGKTFGFHLVEFSSVTFDRRKVKDLRDATWIESYGSSYSLFVLSVEQS
jgi:hypothetical protein